MNETIVETYEDVQETPVSKEDIDAYNNMVTELGLDNLILHENVQKIAPMSDLESNVYRILCPKRTKLHEYKYPIPERVLKAYQKCLPYIEEIAGGSEIKPYILTDEDPDPVLIVQIGYGDQFLIGRWGLELQDFPTLLRRAKEITLAESAKKIAEVRAILDMYENKPDSFAVGVISRKITSVYF